MSSGEAGPTTGWLDRFFESYFAHRPVNATFIGVHHLDHRLPDYSENGAGDTLADMEGLLRELPHPEEAPPSDPDHPTGPGPVDSVWESLDRRLAEGFLRIQSWEYESRHFHRGNPSLYTGEAVFGIMSLLLSDFAPLAERMERAAERMAEVPTLLAQGRENVREAPGAWTERALRECRGALAFLTRGVESLLPGSSTGSASSGEGRFRSASREAARAFQEFRDHLTSELLRQPLDHYACGEEALSLYLRDGHFLDRTPEEILEWAQDQLAEAEARVEEHPTFTPRDLEGLADLHPTVDAYYDAYPRTWDAVRARAEEERLLSWPEFPIRYVPRPLWSREAAPDLYFLFYRSPPAFRRPPVHDYLVTPVEPGMEPETQEELLRANNDSVIKLNHVIHHGSIGHHVQNWHAFRSRSRIGQVAAVDCASRIAMFCGGTMAEGWACYATDLMAEVGALTPLEAFAEMNGRTRMCARTIVDLQLHLGRMTLEDAARFYQDRAGMSPGAARGEAVKNSMFPGAAVIYLLGTQTIRELRRELAEAAARRGSPFVLRDFHDELLSYGSIPVTLIARAMTEGADRVGRPGEGR
jgi:hypothetical protein